MTGIFIQELRSVCLRKKQEWQVPSERWGNWGGEKGKSGEQIRWGKGEKLGNSGEFGNKRR